MSRATPEDVRNISGSTLIDPQIQPFLDAAHLMVNKVEPCATAKGVTEDGLTSAESFLAAHIMSLSSIGQSSDGGSAKTEERFENYQVKYSVSQSTGKGVLSSGYGQTANSLLCGCLQEIDKRQPNITYFGAA